MKKLISFSMLLLSLHSFCQQAEIFLKSSLNKTDFVLDQILAIEEDKIIGANSSYLFTDISAIRVSGDVPKKLAEVSKEFNFLATSFSEEEKLLMFTGTAEPELKSKIDLELDLIFSRKQGASTFMLIGVGFLTTSVFLTQRPYPKNFTQSDIKNQQKLIQQLAVGGGVFLTVGIGLNSNANTKLKSALSRIASK